MQTELSVPISKHIYKQAQANDAPMMYKGLLCCTLVQTKGSSTHNPSAGPRSFVAERWGVGRGGHDSSFRVGGAGIGKEGGGG